MNPQVRKQVITTGDKALGLGDGFILAPALIELSKKYNVKHLATTNSYNILKRINNGGSLQILNMDQQGHFYENDHYKAFNLVYWDVKNALRGLGKHALSVCMDLCDLPPYNKPLPDIAIPPKIESSVKEFMDHLKGPIVVTQPLMSYWNKMITDQKQIKIVDNLLKKGYTVIQITGKGLPPSYLHKGALDLVGKTNIEQTMAFIKHADVFLGCDSFCQHCAAFMKTPSVVMWCGTSPEDFGYATSTNICHPDIAYCQDGKCGRPMRWLYDYDYKDRNNWNSRNEAGWGCQSKLCERAITVDEVVDAVDKELSIGKDRDWTFRNFEYGLSND